MKVKKRLRVAEWIDQDGDVIAHVDEENELIIDAKWWSKDDAKVLLQIVREFLDDNEKECVE